MRFHAFSALSVVLTVRSAAKKVAVITQSVNTNMHGNV